MLLVVTVVELDALMVSCILLLEDALDGDFFLLGEVNKDEEEYIEISKLKEDIWISKFVLWLDGELIVMLKISHSSRNFPDVYAKFSNVTIRLRSNLK